MSSPPNVMVSSTFYDLRQIRADLTRFIIDELGYRPLLSELNSFPVNPDLDTIDNCKARVEKDADIVVLVVGGRYGSIDDKTGKSITNIEFLGARKKGIPIYVFIEKNVLAVISIWKSNPEANFSHVVDTPRLFEFVEYVRSQERVWAFGFETAQEIVDTLRHQLAVLFSESLKTRLKLKGGGLPGYFETLGPESLRIALEKPSAWEYRLFFQSWLDEVQRHSGLIREFQSGLTLGSAEYVAALSAGEWIQTRVHELEGLVQSANKLINEDAQKSFGKPGEPGDPEYILWVTKKLGEVLNRMLAWAQHIRCTRFEEPFVPVRSELALFVDDLIEQFQKFPQGSLAKIEESLTLASSGQPRKIDLVMSFRLSNFDRYENAFSSAALKYVESIK